MSEALGLESGIVRLAEYDDRWPWLFAAEAGRLLACSDGISLRIEHIGSTSIPGMCAKPVLDILAGRPSGTPLDPYLVCIGRAGYVHRGERGVVGREFFRRGEPRAYHVHLVEQEGALWREYLAFRDYLRTHAEVAAVYADLKRSLAARFPRDREAYIDGKTPFVKATVARASIGMHTEF